MRNIDLLIKPASGMCNMNCKYCFYADVGECRDVKNYGFMNEQTQENIVKKALTATEEYCAFGFQGGEPTLAGLAFYRRQVELEKKYNINNVYVVNSIQTNGYAIDEEWARFLAENYLSEDGQYFGGGYGLEHINIRWNGGQHWLKEVSEIAFDILERINGTGV